LILLWIIAIDAKEWKGENSYTLFIFLKEDQESIGEAAKIEG
jgi:hypothetical protein